MEWVSLAIGGWLLASVAAAVVIGVAIRRAERRSQDVTVDAWESELAPPGPVPPEAQFPVPRRPPPVRDSLAPSEGKPTTPAGDSR